MDQNESRRAVKASAFNFLKGTLLSRVFGLVRDMSMAYYFGINAIVAAFLIAFRLSNLLRRIFGEGALLGGFIPYFEEKRLEKERSGARFFRDLFWTLFVILIATIFGLESLLFSLYKSTSFSAGFQQILVMTMIMLPGLVFICLYGLSMALLECEMNYFIPAVAPVGFNIVWIAAIFYCRDMPIYEAMKGISLSVVFAFLVQWLVTAPAVMRYVLSHLSMREWLTPRIFSHKLGKMLQPLLLGVVGVCAVQVNSALDVFIARFASLEAPAFLSYAHRLQQLPLALFGIAISSAIMPPLSRAIKEGRKKDAAKLVQYGLSKNFTILFTITIAIFFMAAPSINLLYGRGNFSNEALIYSSRCLFGYGIGLVPISFIFILASVYYAKGDYKTPMLGSILALIVNLTLNCICVFVLKFSALSIALTTSISAMINVTFLWRHLDVKLDSGLYISFLRVTVLNLVVAVFVALIGIFILQDPAMDLLKGAISIDFSRNFIDQCRSFTTLFASFCIIFLSLSYLFKVNEVTDIISIKVSS
jgi:putative peptidoglycan lipid II flippase